MSIANSVGCLLRQVTNRSSPLKRKRTQTSLLSYDEAVVAGAIELGIKPVVDALNTAGLITIASCEGHAPHIPPFVMFHASVDAARCLAKHLAHGHGKDCLLHYCWELRGRFWPGSRRDELVWEVRTADVRIPGLWRRDIMDGDMHRLAVYVGELSVAGQLCLDNREAMGRGDE